MRLRWWVWLLFGSVGCLILAIQLRTIWLPWIAQNLIVEDVLRPADVIAVFAADEERAKHAAWLYHQQLAPRIVVTGELVAKNIELFCGRRVTSAEFSAKMLADAGVPRSAIVVIQRGTSTYEEAEAVRTFLKTHGYRSVIAVSSPYHMRRVRATLGYLLRGTESDVRYSPAKGGGFEVRSWWKRERDLTQVTNEYLKLAYYHLAVF